MHDYHLLSAGAEAARRRAPTQPIGLFLHIPFPNIEVLRALPVYGELLQAMLAYDVLGFQTETDRDAFRGAAALRVGTQVLDSRQHASRSAADGSITGCIPDRRGRRCHPARGQRESLSTDACKRMIAGCWAAGS